MSKRSERREAERAARKASYQELRQQRAQSSSLPATASAETHVPENTETLLAKAQAYFENDAPIAKTDLEESIAEVDLQPVPIAEPSPIAKNISEAQLSANRANAQLAAGAVTPEGRARSSMNALKHGLTSKIVVLPNEDPAAYQHQWDAFMNAYNPANDDELRLVQSIVDCHWRIDRMMNLETAILLKGHLECAAQFEDRSAFERSQLINAEAYLKCERQMRNLHIQEARLRRTLEKDTAELNRLQAARRHQDRQAELQAQPNTLKADAQATNGFEFSSQVSSPPYRNRPGFRQQKRAA